MPGPLSPAGLRYTKRFAVAISLYVVFVLGAPMLMKLTAYTPLRLALAILPALPILGVIWAVARYLREETDEYVRMRLAQALLVGLGLTLAVCTVWGFAESFGFAPHFPAYDVFPLFCALWGVSQLVRRVSGR